MNRSLVSYSTEEVRRLLRKEAIELCRRLASIAVEIEVIEALRNVRVFVRCTDVDNDRIDKLTKQKA